MKNNEINTEFFVQIIDDLLIDESLKNERLEYLKKQGIILEDKPKIITLDLLKTVEITQQDNVNIEEVVKRKIEIEFEDDDDILDRDIALILVDYMIHANHNYYKEQDYYKELMGVSLE